MFNLYRFSPVNQEIAKGVNFYRSPIGCPRPVLALRESARNPEVNNSVLVADYDSITGRHKIRTECGRSLLIQPSLHVFHEFRPALWSEIATGTFPSLCVTLPKVDRPHRRILRDSNNRTLVPSFGRRSLSEQRNTDEKDGEQRNQMKAHDSPLKSVEAPLL